MGSQNIEDFLTKQMLIEGNIVTYRSLSRQLSLHVNAAKNALATFYSKTRNEGENKLAATYLVSGELQPERQHSDPIDMDVDMDSAQENVEYESDGAEEVQLVEVVLTGEKDLEYTRSKFSKIYSTHIYCLSPTSIRDMDLVCSANDIVRDIDNKKGSEIAAVAGKIVGSDVKQGKYVPLPAPVVTNNAPSTSKASSSVTAETKAPKKTTTITDKPKASDFFTRMKPKNTKDEKNVTKKEAKKSDTKEDLAKSNTKVDAGPSKNPNEEKPAKLEKKRKQEQILDLEPEQVKPVAVSKAKGKTGVKRKSPSSEDDETQREEEEERDEPSVRIRKNAIISDDEDEQPSVVSGRTKGKGKARDKGKQVMKREDEDVLALMDVDDDEVIRVSRSRKASPEPSEAVKSEPEDIEMQDDTEDKPTAKPKRKTKAKKIVPVGKNGLKKKRVMKSKMTVDSKGYMVTEDYSSYESVDEEEPEPETTTKGKGGKNSTDKEKPKKSTSGSKDSTKEEEGSRETSGTRSKSGPKPKPKASSSGSKGKNTIASFFGKPKGSQ
ncbi:DNA polymerase subunit Cdc27 [Lentinula raphanica]|nr:DNA polymerase subunit Cdc27 [Lentinula raphanica]